MGTAMLFAGANAIVGPGGFSVVGRVPLHAAAGCINAELTGGSCARGAATAGFTKALGSIGDFKGSNAITLDTVKYAIIGGTVSAAGGGKFANGALTGAFQYLI